MAPITTVYIKGPDPKNPEIGWSDRPAVRRMTFSCEMNRSGRPISRHPVAHVGEAPNQDAGTPEAARGPTRPAPTRFSPTSPALNPAVNPVLLQRIRMTLLRSRQGPVGRLLLDEAVHPVRDITALH
ncbi:hypothetical protein NJB1907f34b_25190 [Mycobacterium marinum]|nr:hypothetical protein NJB1907E90_11030 [Mycobacterium marinum]GJO04160.1 hypothetical protein NJB1907f34b_25190 [Mycobacterium marinum]GJO13124.1 hypothetical protein NJB1907E11_07730 [Mycobacterium marinum]GJO18205.1 hypothetical protein NJB1728e18_14760 [Mycobacterium marinum]GJO24987.1 hypothetical protein NJB1907f22_11780 [Mycobacterium marinum]